MTLDELLLQLRHRRLILISAEEIWPSPCITQELHRALRRHRQGLKVLMKWASIEVCASRDNHRQYWRYTGGQCYTCTVCQRLLSEVS